MTQEATISRNVPGEKAMITRPNEGVGQPAGGVGGTTKIADSVVSRIAGIAGREVPGVHDMTSTGLGSTFGNLANRMTGQDQADRGVAVQVGEVECIVDLNIVVDYEVSIPQVAMALRRNVSGRIRAMTGLETKEVNINVADLYFPEQDQSSQTAVQ